MLFLHDLPAVIIFLVGMIIKVKLREIANGNLNARDPFHVEKLLVSDNYSFIE